MKARNTEGNVYKVEWRKVAAGYSAWLSRAADVEVEGRDEEELCEQLFEVAMDRFGDGEPCFDFVTPLPCDSKKQNYFDPEWFALDSNEGFRTIGDRAGLYAGRLCEYCDAGIGKRTSAVRMLEATPKSDFAFIWHERPTAYIVTQRFIDFFEPLIGSSMRVVPCAPQKKAKKVFFELELTPEIQLAAHKEATSTIGIVCPSCKREHASYFVCPAIGKGLFRAVERQKLVKLSRGALVAAHGSNHNICLNSDVAKKLKTIGNLKGVLLDRLVMLNPAQIGTFKLSAAAKMTR